MLSILVVFTHLLFQQLKEAHLQQTTEKLLPKVCYWGRRVFWTGFAVHLTFEVLMYLHVIHEAPLLHDLLVALGISTALLDLCLHAAEARMSKESHS
jgi:hypothetical protein